ncbi:MAG: ATP-binding protein [Lachnospiraceae bacterium]
MSLKYNINYEVASSIFLIMLLFFVRLQYDTHSSLNKEFRKLIWFGLLATVMDVTTAVTISYASLIPIQLNLLLNTLYLVSVAGLGYQLMYYSGFYVHRNREKSPFILFNQLLIGLYVVLLILNMFVGYLFSFSKDGTYVKGPAYLSIYVAPCYFIICTSVILICNFQRFRMWQRTSIIIFLLFQVSGVVLQMFFFTDVLLALFTSALGIVMLLFTMETPDYQKLVITIEELSATKKVAEKAKEEAERAREIAQEANRAKSDFLANMSHEIRTPINAVLGMDEMILRESSNPKILEYAADIKRAGNMLLSLINDILDFSKIESGKMDIIPVDYDLGIMLSETTDMIRSRAEEKKLQLELKIEPNTPVHLHGDEVRIRQIITNILTNAVKYTPEGKVILTVSGKKVSEETIQLYVSVKDTGIGIKKEDMGRLFDSFQRVDESRNRSIEGTGLGLSITMRLLNMMGSRLEVESTYGEGSDFYFYLEQKQLDDTVIGEDIQNYYENEKGRISITGEQFYAPDAKILVVDDNEMNLKVFLGLLKSHGMQIDTAMSGKECLARMEQNAYHIIFLDYQMPEMDGVETLRKARELKVNSSKDAVIISLTANAVSGAREMFLQEGFSDYLTKPIIAVKLEKMIRKYLPAELIVKTDLRQKEDNPVESGKQDKGAQAETGLVDWKVGKELCMGNEEFYREILQTFLASHSDTELNRYYEESDFDNYRIKVHAMKTNLANIGAKKVSEMAKQLELALKNENNVSYVREHHEEFIAIYERVLSEVKTYMEREEVDC